MSWQSSWAVVKDSLTTQTQSCQAATVKPSLTVQVESGRAPTTEESSVVQTEGVRVKQRTATFPASPNNNTP